ncbi:diphthamide biosynthesis protein [Wolfiporia cocos MD-104 SS10]|uniref:2-(3-amino-3-carboxypropyl)histidine synthase subunit 2 n=1 Tax=Wolfiporia cocos (strain MD-104) TaxID=742152 RepID=A0A2H3IXR0_WOLCO|nr:diphthamide biosynthesis protein [Wolfiporia cocos MD-104 SS10]
MADTTAFAASGEDVITRTIQLEEDAVPQELTASKLLEYYDIDRTAKEIVSGDYKRIALQFPDELLKDSVPIYRALKSRIGDSRELYVLADTSYGSCCVDEVAAQHVSADAMVHYGHACMSQTSRLPVIYVFGKRDLNIPDCVERLFKSLHNSSNPDPHAIVLRHDVTYAHHASALLEELKATLPPTTRLLYSPLPSMTFPASHNITEPETESPPSSLDGRGRHEDNVAVDTPSENCAIFYIGGESLGLTNLLVTHASWEVHSYDPRTQTARVESSRTNKMLMRRYAVMQKARDADVFGILVGTLGVASYLPLISHLRTILKRAHKKSYTISVGKLNPAKLANFLEIECFVLVACPENSMIEAKDFLRPIVTPYELEVALQAEQSWSGRYVLDFDKLLAEHRQRPDGTSSSVLSYHEQENEDIDQPVFSLVTGKYRHAKRYGAESQSDIVGEVDSSAMVLRNQNNVVATLADSAAGEFLQTRTFRGLETRIGEDAPSLLEQGRSGIARGYQDDHRQ